MDLELELANRQIIIANAIALKLVNFWFDAAQASIQFAKDVQKK
jgi:hypothetical protein